MSADNTLGAVVMRERAADIADQCMAVTEPDGPAAWVRDRIRALPLPDPAELLAAALDLPEIKALKIAAARHVLEWDGEAEDIYDLQVAVHGLAALEAKP